MTVGRESCSGPQEDITSWVLVVTSLSACTYNDCLPHPHFRALQGAKDVQVKDSTSVLWFRY